MVDYSKQAEDGLTLAINAVGHAYKLAEKLEITPQAISQWRRVPGERVIAVERITGVRREVLRPDLYPVEDRAA